MCSCSIFSVQRDTEDLPFLVHSLLGHDRELRSTVSTHVRWLERVLAAHEAECHNQKERRYSDREGACGFAYSLQDIWAEPLSLDQLPGPLVGLHCPLPCPADEAIQSTRLLLHFTNYLFPVFTTKAKPEECQGSTSLSPSQLAAVTYVNKFVETRLVCVALNSVQSYCSRIWTLIMYFIISVCTHPQIQGVSW